MRGGARRSSGPRTTERTRGPCCFNTPLRSAFQDRLVGELSGSQRETAMAGASCMPSWFRLPFPVSRTVSGRKELRGWGLLRWFARASSRFSAVSRGPQRSAWVAMGRHGPPWSAADPAQAIWAAGLAA